MRNELSPRFVLAIVEGENDEVGLQRLLEAVAKRKYGKTRVRIDVIGHDLTQESPALGETALSIVENYICSYLHSYRIRPEEILEIVEICDVDAAFLNDELISYDPGRIYYGNDFIHCARVDEVIHRNNLKRRNIRSLLHASSVSVSGINISYSLYYLSCNFEDVFFRVRNNDSRHKSRFALELDDVFTTNKKEAFLFFNNKKVFPFSDYYESWDSLMKIQSWIPRLSNLNIWVNSSKD